jgi:hypothetical protein
MRKFLLKQIIAFLCLTIYLNFSQETLTHAQICNSQNSPPVDFRGWAKNSTVKVYIDPAITGARRDAVIQAFDNWSVANFDNCSNIHYQFVIVPLPASSGFTVVNEQHPSGNRASTNILNNNITFDTMSAKTFLAPTLAHPPAVLEAMSHEIGHPMGLAHCATCYPQQSTMATRYTYTNDNDVIGRATSPTACDQFKLREETYCPTPVPTPTPTPTANYCPFPADPFQYPTNNGCPIGRINQAGCCACNRSAAFIQQCLQNDGNYDPDLCGCTGSCGADGSCSPIVIDVLGNGFSLTNVPNGVTFDLEGKGNPRQCAWTATDSDEAWLALDRNNNGAIDDGKELFGNVTAQEPQAGMERNGFLALAEYDKPTNGGNADGKINQQDFIFSRLRLWQDANHNGVSETGELKTPVELGLQKLELDYKESRRVDQHGNQFKYRAKVRDTQDAQLGRWAWDVFLVTEP